MDRVAHTNRKTRRPVVVVGIVLLVVAILASCFFAVLFQKTGNATVSSGESTKFSSWEIKAAEYSVRIGFLSFKGCTLDALWYDEESSNANIALINSPDDKLYGVDPGNVIVLYSNFTTSDSSGDDGFNENTQYKNWSWTLVRLGKSFPWLIYEYGLG